MQATLGVALIMMAARPCEKEASNFSVLLSNISYYNGTNTVA